MDKVRSPKCRNVLASLFATSIGWRFATARGKKTRHTLAAVERLDAPPTLGSSDTTTDARAFEQSVSEEAVLH